jgi:hypothetical protein
MLFVVEDCEDGTSGERVVVLSVDHKATDKMLLINTLRPLTAPGQASQRLMGPLVVDSKGKVNEGV